jgi:hypothetical protein
MGAAYWLEIVGIRGRNEAAGGTGELAPPHSCKLLVEVCARLAVSVPVHADAGSGEHLLQILGGEVEVAGVAKHVPMMREARI